MPGTLKQNAAFGDIGSCFDVAIVKQAASQLPSSVEQMTSRLVTSMPWDAGPIECPGDWQTMQSRCMSRVHNAAEGCAAQNRLCARPEIWLQTLPQAAQQTCGWGDAGSGQAMQF